MNKIEAMIFLSQTNIDKMMLKFLCRQATKKKKCTLTKDSLQEAAIQK